LNYPYLWPAPSFQYLNHDAIKARNISRESETTRLRKNGYENVGGVIFRKTMRELQSFNLTSWENEKFSPCHA
jgi:hypothetical protein